MSIELIIEGLVIMLVGFIGFRTAKRGSQRALQVERLFFLNKQRSSWLSSAKAYRILGAILLGLGALTVLIGLVT